VGAGLAAALGESNSGGDVKHETRRLTTLLRLGCACSLALVLTLRSDAATDASVHELIAERLADVPGKELDLLTVEYPPGGSSKPHRHNADVLV
jgi:hypothetical protein